MSKRNEEVPGNTMQSAVNLARLLEKIARPVMIFQGRYEGERTEGVEILAIRFKAPGHPMGEWLAVVSASIEDERVVAFHKADDFSECLKGVLNRINNGSIKWRSDEYNS